MAHLYGWDMICEIWVLFQYKTVFPGVGFSIIKIILMVTRLLHWNLSSKIYEVRIKTYKYYHLPGLVLIKKILWLFSLSWKTAWPDHIFPWVYFIHVWLCYVTRLHKICNLIRCCLVTPYGSIDLSQCWLRQWHVSWRHQTITQTILTYHQHLWLSPESSFTKRLLNSMQCMFGDFVKSPSHFSGPVN